MPAKAYLKVIFLPIITLSLFFSGACSNISNSDSSKLLALLAGPNKPVPAPPADDTSYFQIMIDSRIAASKIGGDEKIHFQVQGKKLELTSPVLHGYAWLTGGKDGENKWTDWNNPVFHIVSSAEGSADGAIFMSTAPGAGGYDFTLDQLPTVTADGKQYHVLKIPFRDPDNPTTHSLMGSGRIYIGLGEKIWSQINGTTEIASGPDINNPSCGANTRFDFMECNCATPEVESKKVCYINTTNVDFFSIGLAIKGRTSEGAIRLFGLDLGKSTAPVASLIGDLKKLGGDYAGSLQEAPSGSFLRFRSPRSSFSVLSTALDTAIHSGFTKYRDTDLSFKDTDNVQFTARIDADYNINFTEPSVFTLAPKSAGTLPTTLEVVKAPGGENGIFKTGISGHADVAVAWINAFLNRGVFEDTSLWNYASMLDKKWYPSGTPHNDYSRIIHDHFYNNSAYGLPYDEPGGLKDNPTEPKISDCTATTLAITID